MSPTPIFGDTAPAPHALDHGSQAESQLRGRRARQSRLAALDPDRMTEALKCLLVIDPEEFDLILAAAERTLGPAEPEPDEPEESLAHLLQETCCLACQAPVARFESWGGAYAHYDGDPLDSFIQPYEADHAPVLRHPAMT